MGAGLTGPSLRVCIELAELFKAKAESLTGKKAPPLAYKTNSGESATLAAFNGTAMVIFGSFKTGSPGSEKVWKEVEMFSKSLDPNLARIIYVETVPVDSVTGAGQEETSRVNAQAVFGEVDDTTDGAVAEEWGVFQTPMFYLVSNTNVVSYRPDVWTDWDKSKTWMNEMRKRSLAGAPAPDFRFTTLEGSKKKLSDLKGRSVVLGFILPSLHLDPSNSEVGGNIQKAAAKAQELGVSIILVGPKSARPGFDFQAAIKEVLGEHQIAGFAEEPDRKEDNEAVSIFDQYANKGTPAYVLVGPDGKIGPKQIGGESKDRFLNAVQNAAALSAPKQP